MPAFKMSVSKEQVEGKEVVVEGIYKLKFIKFAPKLTKLDPNNPGKERSINLNAEYEIVDHPDHAGRKIYELANMKSYNIQTEICHCFGIPLELDTTDDTYFIPGTWDSRADFNSDDPETYEYRGPLTGKVGMAEIAVTSWNGRSRNQVRRYLCGIPTCAVDFPQIRHVQNLIKS